MNRAALVAFVDGVEVARVECPSDLGERDWLLGVVAVQLHERGGRLRAHLTGWKDAVVHELAGDAVVHVVFGGAALPAPPSAAPAGFAVHHRGALVAATPFAPGRAFGHVFCRYLASGTDDAGFDLTPFLELPPGVKYDRLVSEPLSSGDVVTYTIRRT